MSFRLQPEGLELGLDRAAVGHGKLEREREAEHFAEPEEVFTTDVEAILSAPRSRLSCMKEATMADELSPGLKIGVGCVCGGRVGEAPSAGSENPQMLEEDVCRVEDSLREERPPARGFRTCDGARRSRCRRAAGLVHCPETPSRRKCQGRVRLRGIMVRRSKQAPLSPRFPNSGGTDD